MALATLRAPLVQKWGTFSLKMESLRKWKEVLRIGVEGEKNMVAGCKYKLAVLCFIMAA